MIPPLKQPTNHGSLEEQQILIPRREGNAFKNPPKNRTLCGCAMGLYHKPKATQVRLGELSP